MKLDWPSTARMNRLVEQEASRQWIVPTSRQKITVEMPMMMPGVSTGETTTIR